MQHVLAACQIETLCDSEPHQLSRSCLVELLGTFERAYSKAYPKPVAHLAVPKDGRVVVVRRAARAQWPAPSPRQGRCSRRLGFARSKDEASSRSTSESSSS